MFATTDTNLAAVLIVFGHARLVSVEPIEGGRRVSFNLEVDNETLARVTREYEDRTLAGNIEQFMSQRQRLVKAARQIAVQR